VMLGVSTRTASDAWAVGSQLTVTFRTVIQHWDGTAWTRVPSPNLSPRGGSQLRGVSASSASDAWAVGYGASDTGVIRPLIEHWDGSSWTIAPSPKPPGTVYLSAVSATSATDAWAVGSSNPHGPTDTFTEHWDGSSWTVVSSPSPSTGGDDQLYGVSATSATNAWAVGFNAKGQQYRPLILHWDGVAWSKVPCPWGSRGAAPRSILTGVSGVSATKAWAVGYKATDARTLIESWNGTEWKLQPSPAGKLNAVDAVSATDAWAVGDNGRILHFDGVSWTQTPTLPQHIDRRLFGVSASSGTNAFAVGYRITDRQQSLLFDRWDGATWSELPSP
jgi:hypothetical protein